MVIDVKLRFNFGQDTDKNSSVEIVDPIADLQMFISPIDTLKPRVKFNFNKLMDLDKKYNHITSHPSYEDRIHFIHDFKFYAFSYILDVCLTLESIVNYHAFKINPISQYDFSHIQPIDEFKFNEKFEKSIWCDKGIPRIHDKIKTIFAYFLNKHTNSKLRHGSDDFLSVEIDLSCSKFNKLREHHLYKDSISVQECLNVFQKLIYFRNELVHSKPSNLTSSSIKNFNGLKNTSDLTNYSFFRLLFNPYFPQTFSMNVHDIDMRHVFNTLYSVKFFTDFFELLISKNSEIKNFKSLVNLKHPQVQEEMNRQNMHNPLQYFSYFTRKIDNPEKNYDNYIEQISTKENIKGIPLELF